MLLSGLRNLLASDVARGLGLTQKTQYPLIKEHTLNYRGLLFVVIYGIFLKYGVLGSFGKR